MLSYLSRYSFEDNPLTFLPGRGLVLDEIQISPVNVDEHFQRYVWYLAEEAWRLFTRLSLSYEFVGHDFIGYVTIVVKADTTLDLYMIELSRGGGRKVRVGPRRPAIRFYNYLSDGTRLESEIVIGLTEPDADSDKLVSRFEIFLEQLVIRNAMYVQGTHSTGSDSPYFKARVETAVEVIRSCFTRGCNSFCNYIHYCEAYGFNSWARDFAEAERLFVATPRLPETINPA